MLAAVGLLTAQPVTLEQAQAATDPSATDSTVTVKWAGDNGQLQDYQPERTHLIDNADGSGHWLDFKDLQITVSQTRDLTDQAVTLTYSGMAATTPASNSSVLGNYLTMMQCWGTDPSAPDFAETCQYGAYDGGLLQSQIDATVGKLKLGGFDRGSVRFRTVQNATTKLASERKLGEPSGLLNYFQPSTTNEILDARFGADRRGQRTFEVQTADASPALGCGLSQNQGGAGNRCWLIVVPRGSHSVVHPDGSSCIPAHQTVIPFGQSSPISQSGSPIDPACATWSNRMVIPLDFTDVDVSCPAGVSERRMVGSELITAAASSWKPALCTAEGGANYSLASGSEDLARTQLLAGGGLAFVQDPIDRRSLSTEMEIAQFDSAKLHYAPVAVSAPVVAYQYRDALQREYDLTLSPRLLAKILTNSYPYQVAVDSAETDVSHLGEVNRTYPTWASDPDVIALNPALADQNVSIGADNPAPVLVGPSSSDAIARLWEYIQADDEARAFLQGARDPWGMTVNPYFLPSAHPNSLAGGVDFDLSSDRIDTFPKSDRWLVPGKEYADRFRKGRQVDILAKSPYVNSFAAAAVATARLDPADKTIWDSFKVVSPGVSGDFVAGGPLLDTGMVITVVDAPAALRYNLRIASLVQPNKDDVVSFDNAAQTAALTAQVENGVEGVTKTDVRALPANAWPLTGILYALIDDNAATLDDRARGDYAALLRYAAGDGQKPGEARGQLPAGYVPLPADLRARTLAIADEIAPSPGADLSDEDSSTTTGAAPTQGAAAGPASSHPVLASQTATTITTAGVAAADETPAAPASSTVGLMGAIAVGAAGLVGGPWLLRRRGPST
ncbi:hypothetical protein [Salinibacterium sp. ZJ450]|uniref:hypothetical protein n=1 Tax=Salinibacterium sp. ZJ450 TaxID=2708338 RepID=UPI0014217766|nr:hypothetical protein [Salinibacterium sp. ZJ450]